MASTAIGQSPKLLNTQPRNQACDCIPCTSGIVWYPSMRRHGKVPLMAAAMASAMPVLPEVASISVSPGFITPLRSASWIILNAGLHSNRQLVSAAASNYNKQALTNTSRATEYKPNCPTTST